MSTPTDDAQRELERRALRNVRGLVDRMEESDEADARTQKRLLVAIIVGAALIGLGIVFAVLGTAGGGRTVEIPAKAPVRAPGP